jgi:chemotaxis signal transduction protein
MSDVEAPDSAEWKAAADSAATPADSPSSSSGSAASSRREAGAPSRRRRGREGVYACLFRLHGARYAFDAAIVREALTVTQVVPVPLTPPWLLGLTSLRGTPVPVVDLESLLELGPAAPPTPALQVLVVEVDGITVGARVERVEAVQPLESARRDAPSSPSEHRAVAAMLEWPGGVVATLLQETELARRLNEMRFRPRWESAPA